MNGVIQAFVLKKEEAKAPFMMYKLVGLGTGVMTVLYRKSSKGAGQELDLFDLAEFRLRSSSGGALPFVEEYSLLRHHGGLGKRYDSLKFASKWAQLILQMVQNETPENDLFKLTENVVSACDLGDNGGVAYFKAVYLLLKEEGLPVKEDWLGGLTSGMRDVALRCLKTPLNSLVIDKEESDVIIHKLEIFLKEHHYLTQA